MPAGSLDKPSHDTPDNSSVGPPDDLIELGRVIGAHGIRGWIKIQPFSSDSQALGAAKRWWVFAPVAPVAQSFTSNVELRKRARPLDVVWAKPHGAAWIASVKGCADRNAAEALKNHTILVSRTDFPMLDTDEYYWVDLIGCTAVTDDAGESSVLGVVESIQDSPAHPILVIRQQSVDTAGEYCDRVDDRGKPIYSLVPFVQAHVGEVDLARATLLVHWPRDF